MPKPQVYTFALAAAGISYHSKRQAYRGINLYELNTVKDAPMELQMGVRLILDVPKLLMLSDVIYPNIYIIYLIIIFSKGFTKVSLVPPCVAVQRKP